MSSVNRQRLYRAVRLLPDSVMINHGGVQRIKIQKHDADAASQDAPLKAIQKVESLEKLEIKALNTKIKDMSADMSLLRDRALGLELQMQQQAAALEEEKTAWLARSQEEIKQAKEQAASCGRIEGLAKGETEGRAQADKKVREEYGAKFNALVSLIETVHASLASSTEALAQLEEPRMLRLWEAILSRMLFAQVELNPNTVNKILSEVLARISDKDKVLVYLNPSDMSVVEDNKDKLTDIIRGIKHLEFTSDDHVDKGSCLVETNLGVYDARWRTQLEQVSKQVDGILLEGADQSDAKGADDLLSMLSNF